MSQCIRWTWCKAKESNKILTLLILMVPR